MTRHAGRGNFYDILGVEADATQAEIRQAYLQRAKEYHPDLNQQDDQADRRFKQIRHVYDVLRDPIRRVAYDADPSRFNCYRPLGAAGWEDSGPIPTRSAWEDSYSPSVNDARSHSAFPRTFLRTFGNESRISREAILLLTGGVVAVLVLSIVPRFLRRDHDAFREAALSRPTVTVVSNTPIAESPSEPGQPEPAVSEPKTPITRDAIHQVLDSADKLREQVEDDPLVSLSIPNDALPELPPPTPFPEVGQFAESQPSIPMPSFDGSNSPAAHDLQYARLPPAPNEADSIIGGDWNVESASISTGNSPWAPVPPPSTYGETGSVGFDLSSGAPTSKAIAPTARPHSGGSVAVDTLPAIPGWRASVLAPSGVILEGVPRLGPTPTWMMGPPPPAVFPRGSEGFGPLRRLPGAEAFLPPGQLPMRPLLPTGPTLGGLPSSPRHQFHFGPSIRPLTSGIPVGPSSFDAAGGSR